VPFVRRLPLLVPVLLLSLTAAACSDEPRSTAAPSAAEATGAPSPTKDTGVQSNAGNYGFCPGSMLRALEYGGGALYVLFGDAIGPGMTLYQWTLTGRGRPDDVPQASALVGDVATFEFGVGDTVAELRAGVEGSELEVREGDEMLPPSFTLADQSSGFSGVLTGTQPSAMISTVQAGEGCGE
jgi:hypothetical protein